MRRLVLCSLVRNDRSIVVAALCGHLREVSNAPHSEALAAQAVRITSAMR